MIQIRNNFFETNSSSCHAFMIPRDEDASIQKTIDLTIDSDRGDLFRKMIRNLDEKNSEILANWFYYNGVENIIYNGSNSYFRHFIETAKDNPQDLGLVNSYDIENNWTRQDFINFFFGEAGWNYFDRDDYLSDYRDRYAIYHIGFE